MLNEKLLHEINTQIKYEQFSAQLYLAMAAYCDEQDLDGFANFFKVQAEEERFHATKFYDFVNDMGERVRIQNLEEPKNDYNSVLELFEEAYKHEQFVTERINYLTDIAEKEKDRATISMLQWFIDEQVEEEAMFSSLIKKLERIGNDSSGLYMLDTELAARTFTPPADTEA